MSALVEELHRAKRAERHRLFAEYAALVQRADAPEAGDVQRICNLLEQWGADVETFEADVAALKALRSCEARAAEAPDLKRAVDALEKRYQKAREHAENIYRAAKAKARLIDVELITIQDKHKRAVEASALALHHRTALWRVLGGPKPPPRIPMQSPGEVDTWLCDDPPAVTCPADPDGLIVGHLRRRGYQPCAERPGVWAWRDGAPAEG